MTDKQKEAINVLNRVREKLTDDEYFTMLEFIIEEKQVTYIPQPTIPWTTPQPLQPYYGQRWEVTCKIDDNARQSEM